MGCGGSASSNRADVRKGPVPTLGYWDCKGRGYPSRLLLHNLGVKFEDKLYKMGDETPGQCWADVKPKLGIPFANMPYWIDGDTKHSETVPILRTICRKYCPSYLGKTQKEQNLADSFTNTIYSEFPNFFGPYMFAPDHASKKTEGVAKAKEFLELICKCLGN